ncbi:MAG TPA: thioesterase family protein [Beijerinckiaceae bacterium]|nr:thioesterase family protein [Beijerinckiaceae bacterium]
MTGQTKPTRKPRWQRSQFRRFVPMPTRWDDNDAFGHVNNVKYYAFFDTAITFVEIEAGIFNSGSSPLVPYVVDSSCTYFEGVAFPDVLEVGVAIERIGRTSLTYRLGVFRPGADLPVAQGLFTHVYVDRATERPAPMPDAVLKLAESLLS